jgi:hypothetical protein
MTVGLADVDLNDGDHGAAQALYEEALTLLNDVGDKWWMAWCLEGMAEVAVAQRRAERAARLFGTAEALRGAIGASRPTGFRDYFERDLAAARDSLDKATFEKSASTCIPSTRSSACLPGRRQPGEPWSKTCSRPLISESSSFIGSYYVYVTLPISTYPPTIG